MSKTKSVETIQREAKEAAELTYLADCLENSKLVESSFAVKNDKGKYVPVNLRTAMEELMNKVGYLTYLSFTTGGNDDPKECDAAKYLIQTLGNMNLQMRQIFDAHVEELNAGRGNRKLVSVTKIRGKSEPKVEVVEDDTRTPQEIAKSKVMTITLR